MLEYQLEQQRAQSRADDQWLRESDSRHVSMSYPSIPAPSGWLKWRMVGGLMVGGPMVGGPMVGGPMVGGPKG